MSLLTEDRAFQDLLITLICKDRMFLQSAEHLLDPNDFKISRNGTSNGVARQVVFQSALRYWQKYGEPIGRMLTTEIRQHAKQSNLDSSRKQDLIQYAKTIIKTPARKSEAVLDHLLTFKKEAARQEQIERLVKLHGSGKLTDEVWEEAFEAGLKRWEKDPFKSSDFFSTLEDRIERRDHWGDERYPVLLIDPVDSMVRAIARGHTGLIMAPYKRGKSLALIWIASAYTVQKLNVLYITLEDPKAEVEDRFDASITGLPLKNLTHLKKTLRRKFNRFAIVARNRLRILDGTEDGYTVAMIGQAIDQYRKEGFNVDAVIVDYDDEIIPKKRKEKRIDEFSQIYRDMRQMAAKKQVFWWTAAQTRRGTKALKILTGDSLADDISKVRKVAFALALGQGDWGDDSIYWWVAAHKFDREQVGCNAYSCKERMLIYDREKTMEKLKRPERVIE